ncbi:hypothetical protein ABEO87_07820, partial [Geobacillus stearothermophilus]|uniref:hypothetical protein n=1 Tax=Geobacillus stearothermophilus TaxID=1422 RepID=UPI003D209CAF
AWGGKKWTGESIFSAWGGKKRTGESVFFAWGGVPPFFFFCSSRRIEEKNPNLIIMFQKNGRFSAHSFLLL